MQKKTKAAKAEKKIKTASAVAAVAAAPRKPAAKKAPAAKAPATKAKVSKVSPEERQKMIELAAYYRAERLGWQVDSHENWVAAEAEVDAALAKKK
jgi:hypothetical protein